MEETKVSFKKRGSKSTNIRKKGSNEEELETGDEVSSETLQDIKLQQTVRARKSGSSLEALSKPATVSTKVTVNEESGKTIESVMGTQYTTQMDYGISSNNIPHKKLMDQYIEDKLGLAKPAQEVKKVASEEDNLYKIPEHMRVENMQATKAAIKADESGIVPAWSTQLAEVALPISFKLKNIEATERIANKAGDNVSREGPSVPNIASMYRFNTQERAAKLHPAMAEFEDSQSNTGHKRPQKSSDDYALEQYKKRQMNQRR